jgi:hypothetical protein
MSCPSDYVKSGVGIPAPMLQRVVVPATSVSIQATQQAIAQQGSVLMRGIDGDFFAFGPATMASKDALTVDTSAVDSVDKYFGGPVMARLVQRDGSCEFVARRECVKGRPDVAVHDGV